MCDFVYDTKMYDTKCTTFKIMNCDHVSFHLILYLDLNKYGPFQNKAQAFSVMLTCFGTLGTNTSTLSTFYLALFAFGTDFLSTNSKERWSDWALFIWRFLAAFSLLPHDDIPDAFGEKWEIEIIPDTFIEYKRPLANMKITNNKSQSPLYQSFEFLHQIEAIAMKPQCDMETGALPYKRPKYLTLTIRLNTIFEKFYRKDEAKLELLKKMANLLKQ